MAAIIVAGQVARPGLGAMTKMKAFYSRFQPSRPSARRAGNRIRRMPVRFCEGVQRASRSGVQRQVVGEGGGTSRPPRTKHSPSGLLRAVSVSPSGDPAGADADEWVMLERDPPGTYLSICSICSSWRPSGGVRRPLYGFGARVRRWRRLVRYLQVAFSSASAPRIPKKLFSLWRAFPAKGLRNGRTYGCGRRSSTGQGP